MCSFVLYERTSDLKTLLYSAVALIIKHKCLYFRINEFTKDLYFIM